MNNWVNLQDYLALNEEQGADMGQRVYGEVAEKAKNASGQLSQAQAGYGSKVQAGILGGPEGDGSQYSEGEAAANSMMGFSGPKSLDEYDPTLAGNVNKASQAVQAAADPNQLGSVVQETFGAQGASGVGGSALDGFLTGASPAGGQLQGLGKQYESLLQSLGLAETDAYAKSQLGMAQSGVNANQWAQLATNKAVDAKNAKNGLNPNLSDEPDSARKGLTQRQEAGLQNWYGQMKSSLSKEYVGEGKRFRDQKQFDDYLGGVGQGFAESFGGGFKGDSDPRLRNLAQLGRVAFNKFSGSIGLNADAQLPIFLKMYDQYGGSGAVPAEWSADYKPKK